MFFVGAKSKTKVRLRCGYRGGGDVAVFTADKKPKIAVRTWFCKNVDLFARGKIA